MRMTSPVANRAIVFLSLCAGIVCLGASTPTVETTPIPTPAKPDFSALQFEVGAWTCASKSERRPAAYTVTSITTMDPTGYWMITKSVQHKTSWSTEIRSTDLITYDANAGRWADVYTDNRGNYDVTTSAGWKGNTRVWKDMLFTPGFGIVSTMPVTETKVSDTRTTAHTSFTEKSGRVVGVNTICNKTE